jgi:hypothetical protein
MGTQRYLPAPVPDLIDARHRQPGGVGELLDGDAVLESFADQATQLGIGGLECLPPAFAPLGRDEVTPRQVGQCPCHRVDGKIAELIPPRP